MTRKKIGIGLLEAFTEPCEACAGRGLIVHHEPVLKNKHIEDDDRPQRQSNNRENARENGNNKGKNKGRNKQNNASKVESEPVKPRLEPAKVVTAEKAEEAKNLMSKIAASTMGSIDAAPKTLDTVLEALPEAPIGNPPKRKSRRVSSGGEITPGQDN
jgi:ribonuclease E